ncbi:hypothetical protein [Tabrizicola sp.]|uniref:hypothetical protein n=1 Tax=Tabrizicola sp. TaxID=2005166 RepID=UPI0027326C7C|nr:hypothetical protein [Tabrizicola sp.]MDP3195845.1 hypothetical protein [Tabrizicola sp.]
MHGAPGQAGNLRAWPDRVNRDIVTVTAGYTCRLVGQDVAELPQSVGFCGPARHCNRFGLLQRLTCRYGPHESGKWSGECPTGGVAP